MDDTAMSGGRQRVNPVDAALARLADLAGRGVAASRMARELDVILADWAGGERPAAPDEVAERLAAMHEQLVAGASDAAEQVGDVDADEPAALRHAKLVHAALLAAVEAVAQAQAAQHAAPSRAAAVAPAVVQPLPVAPGRPVTIDPLAGRNPQGVDHNYPAEVRREIGAERVSGGTKPGKARTTGSRRRKVPNNQEKSLPTLLR
jgi:hypothetical protein